MQDVSTRHRRGGRGGIVRFGQDGPLLLGRRASARAGDNDVRNVHRSRHRPIQRHPTPLPVSSAEHYPHKAAVTERLPATRRPILIRVRGEVLAPRS